MASGKKIVYFLLILIGVTSCNLFNQKIPLSNPVILVSIFNDLKGNKSFKEIRGKNFSRYFIRQKHNNKIVIKNKIKASWVRFKTIDQVDSDKNYLLELNRPTLDKVTAYILDKSGKWVTFETGDTIPFFQRSVSHENFLFQISGQVLKQYDYPVFLKIENPVITFTSIRLWEEKNFQDINAIRSLLMGLFFGVLLSLIIFNFLIYLSIRDISYLWYVVYLGFILFYLLAISGYTFRFLWPNNPSWANQSTYFSLLISMSMGLGFCRSMFQIPSISPKFATVMKWTGIIIILLAASQVLVGYPFLAGYMSYIGLTVMFLMFFAVITSIRSGYKPAYYAGLGFLFLFAGSMMLILFKLGVLPRNIISEYGIQIGVLFEAFILSFALAYRINYVNEKLKLSNQKILEAEKLFSRKLIDFQDRERQETSATLHDSIGQKLLVIKIQLGQIIRLFGLQESHNKIKSIKGLIQEVINDIRDISHALHPHQIERLTLKEALEDVVYQSFRDTKIDYQFDFSGIAECLDKKAGLHIYRIVQESINNIIRHSSAKNVSFKSHKTKDGKIEIIIQDDGRGIVGEKWFENNDFSKAYGLANIKERVNSLGGTVLFASVDGAGFQIKTLISCNMEE